MREEADIVVTHRGVEYTFKKVEPTAWQATAREADAPHRVIDLIDEVWDAVKYAVVQKFTEQHHLARMGR